MVDETKVFSSFINANITYLIEDEQEGSLKSCLTVKSSSVFLSAKSIKNSTRKSNKTLQSDEYGDEAANENDFYDRDLTIIDERPS